MRKLASLLAILLLTFSMAVAQNRTINGVVRDAEGKPVEAASVVVVGSKTGTLTNAQGAFTITVPSNGTIEITRLGFEPLRISVSGKENFDLTLTPGRTNELENVVVTVALGQVRQAKELGYSTAKVRATELTQAKSVNLQNGLTGKVSGLNVATTNSGVMGNTRINLRGIRSLTGNNQPMLVLDGVPVNLGFLSSINPNDIADVTILKSAAGTAIYGPDGVNGAIVVTTKKGNKQKPTVNFSHTTQVETVSYLPKFQELFGGGYAPDALGYGTFEPIEQQSWGEKFDGTIRQFGQTGPNGEKLEMPYSYNKNGRRNFFDNGTTNQTDVSYSAGDFYVSAQNVAIRGTLPGDRNDRRSVTLKAEKEYNRFKMGFNLRYTQSKYDMASNNQFVYYNVTGSPGNYDLSRFENWRTDYFSSPDGYFTPYLDNRGKTPYFAKDNWRQKGTIDDILGNVQMDFKATDWLSFTYRLGLTNTSTAHRNTRGAFNYGAFHQTLRDHGTLNITSAVTDYTDVGKRLTSEIFASLHKEFGDFELGGTLGQSFRESSSRFISAGSDNLGTAELFTLALRKGEPNATVDNSKSRLERYFGKVAFGYKNWAFLEATTSYDFDSRLVKPGTYERKSDIGFFYPSVSASVLLHEAIAPLKASKAISYLKLRGSWAKTGNVNLSPYSYQNVFTNSTFFPYGDILSFQPTATTVADKYKPEFVVSKDLGIEVGFLRNRINFEATVYHQNNTDQIITIQQSVATGYTGALQNAASFVNRGLELDLKLTPLVKIGNLDIDFKINYTKQENEVTELVEGIDELGIGNYNYVIKGTSAYRFKLTDYIRDPQGRVIVDAVTGMPTQNPNLSLFGKTTPTDFLGMSLNLTWKGLSFSAVADYRGGNQIVVDELGAFLDDNGISARSAANDRRAFVFPNSVYWDGSKYVPNTNVYTQTYGRLFWNSELNTGVISNYVANGAFWKLRELALNYQVPVRIFGAKVGNVIKGMTVGINGRNLFMWVPKSNEWTDPEFQGGNGNSPYTGNATGRSTSYNFPPTRIFGGNISINF